MALDELHVVGVCSTDTIRTIQTANYGVCHIASYKGKIVPVVDISSPDPHCTESMAVLILRLQRRHVALLVDEVRETVQLVSDKVHISNGPEMNGNNYIHGHFSIESSMIVVMDVERFFSPLLKP